MEDVDAPQSTTGRRVLVESVLARRLLIGLAGADVLAAYLAPFQPAGYWPVVPLTAGMVLVLFGANIAGYTPSPAGSHHFLMRFLVLWAIMAAIAGTVGHGAGWVVVSCAGGLAAALTYCYAYAN